ncbi:MAG: protein phosphatase [Ruminiclostridium sp.]|nr:protein phosphatase [Ruminiclostridium sp.]
MSTPNMAEVLREEAQKAERLRILLMALDCKDLGELIQKLKAEDQK